jgi:hypothetical protein
MRKGPAAHCASCSGYCVLLHCHEVVRSGLLCGVQLSEFKLLADRAHSGSVNSLFPQQSVGMNGTGLCVGYNCEIVLSLQEALLARVADFVLTCVGNASIKASSAATKAHTRLQTPSDTRLSHVEHRFAILPSASWRSFTRSGRMR